MGVVGSDAPERPEVGTPRGQGWACVHLRTLPAAVCLHASTSCPGPALPACAHGLVLQSPSPDPSGPCLTFLFQQMYVLGSELSLKRKGC